MVKKCLLLLVSLSLLILCGCSESSGASAGKIIPPPVRESPLGGKWAVLQELDEGHVGGKESHQWIGTSVQFAPDAIEFDGRVWDKLSYKIKRVDAVDYLTTKYIPSSAVSVPDSRKVEVITVYAASNYLGEFMKLDEKSMVFFTQDKDLLLKKISGQTDGILKASEKETQDLNSGGSEEASGILLGLRVPKGDGYAYRTLWIAADHRRLHPVLVSEQLFFPRTSGFWELNVLDDPADRETDNLLAARNLTIKNPETEKPENETEDPASVDSAIRIIDYIGNDYVAIEKKGGGAAQLQILPVDKLSSPTEIKVSDLLGSEVMKAYLNARENAVTALKEKGATSIDRDESGENFGLTRKNGHWFLVGRINYRLDGEPRQEDFELKAIPPANLIFYDTLTLSWHSIRDRVPDAMDAFTSPGRDIALVETKNKLTVYPIGAEHLAESPLAELSLPEGASVIMAEWATGSYVESWEKSFLSYGAQTLSDSSLRIFFQK